jgi:hypothetical protein
MKHLKINNMEAKLIHIECNTFSGVMRIQLGQNVISLELGTPNFNDYGEYRLSSFEIKPMSLEKYQERFPHPLLNHHLCELSDNDVEFWKRHNEFIVKDDKDETKQFKEEDYKQIDICEDGNDYVMCGQDKEKVFHVFYNGNWIPYETWKANNEPNSYNKLMYPCAEIFYKWYNDKIDLSIKPSTDASLNIYPQ